MIDWAGLERAADEAIIGVVNRWVDAATASAKRKAPVRKVFAGASAREHIRLKSIEEIEADRSLRRRLGLGPEYGPLNPQRVAPATTLTQYAHQELSQRRVVSPGRLALRSAQERLDRRGRYELRTMRAVHKKQLGGRLRDEIYGVQARIQGSRITGKIVSPTPYAKHQELGNRHNPAHPYMRPGARDTAEPAKRDLGRVMPGVVAPHLRATIPVVIKI